MFLSIKNIIENIRNSERTLFILCGLPYSGKTYLAHKILDSVSCISVSIDDILQSQGYDWNTQKLPDEEGWQKVFAVSYQKTKEALQSGSNVLYDSTNHTKTSRDVLRKISDEVDAETRVIYVYIPLDVMWLRWEETRRNKSRPVINKILVESTVATFEIPTSDEKVLMIRNI